MALILPPTVAQSIDTVFHVSPNVAPLWHLYEHLYEDLYGTLMSTAMKETLKNLVESACIMVKWVTRLFALAQEPAGGPSL